MVISYQNPVWPEYFADPFVLEWQGRYYAYGTGQSAVDAESGRVFPVLRSADLMRWEKCGEALEPLPDAAGSAYWAPEVAERNGRFYLYYSAAQAGGDETHRLRVAVADRPAGPFQDTGALLLPGEGFTIDAHPFRDPQDGQWYLFFAKDFFDARAGTALGAVPLAEDMISVSGPATTILRPSSDWQIYQRDRPLYDRVWDAWHTVEGPTVTRYGGRYYLFYSGGNWQTDSYGVGYAVADSVLGPYAEPEQGPVVLRGDGDRVIGPGHNCVVLGLDHHTLFVVYHAWDAARTARRMCIDPLKWTAAGPRCLGPTSAAQTLSLPLQNR